ncbi:hypothetical protein KIN20_032313 [Parelaphostrongylus tenuis]|uniref:Uncharacterized protein n=1 Tax=Parelaphostrongylus tenuis TaxID=148309 RepID=A0AAD5WHY3_PARTN|nr:hypothetical protein KIN20_032313 [Parelaphostrongylus tenuis]
MIDRSAQLAKATITVFHYLEKNKKCISYEELKMGANSGKVLYWLNDIKFDEQENELSALHITFMASSATQHELAKLLRDQEWTILLYQYFQQDGRESVGRRNSLDLNIMGEWIYNMLLWKRKRNSSIENANSSEYQGKIDDLQRRQRVSVKSSSDIATLGQLCSERARWLCSRRVPTLSGHLCLKKLRDGSVFKGVETVTIVCCPLLTKNEIDFVMRKMTTLSELVTHSPSEQIIIIARSLK